MVKLSLESVDLYGDKEKMNVWLRTSSGSVLGSKVLPEVISTKGIRKEI